MDAVFFNASVDSTAQRAVVHADIVNQGRTTYKVHDNCASRWLDVSIRRASGQQVYRGQEVVCDMCSAGEAFPPGARRHAAVTWDGNDATQDPPQPAPAGGYFVAVRASVDVGGAASDCGGGPFATGTLELAFTKR